MSCESAATARAWLSAAAGISSGIRERMGMRRNGMIVVGGAASGGIKGCSPDQKLIVNAGDACVGIGTVCAVPKDNAIRNECPNRILCNQGIEVETPPPLSGFVPTLRSCLLRGLPD